MCLHCLGLASYVVVRELTVIRIAVKNYSGIGGIVNGLVTFGTVWSSLKNVQLFLIVNLTKIIYVFYILLLIPYFVVNVMKVFD